MCSSLQSCLRIAPCCSSLCHAAGVPFRILGEQVHFCFPANALYCAGKSTLLKTLESGYTNKVSHSLAEVGGEWPLCACCVEGILSRGIQCFGVLEPVIFSFRPAPLQRQVPGDGREMVVTIPNAFKIRAEDGRRVQGVNISPFISNLPMSEPHPSTTRSTDAPLSTQLLGYELLYNDCNTKFEFRADFLDTSFPKKAADCTADGAEPEVRPEFTPEQITIRAQALILAA